MKPAKASSAKYPKSKLRRELIVDAAQELLLDEGYSAITISNVASRAEITPSHFRYYFPTLDDLVVELHKIYLENYKTAIADAVFSLRGKESPLSILERLIDTHIDMVRDHKHDVIIWETQAWGARNAVVKEFHEEWVDWYTDNVAALIREANPDISEKKSYRLAALISVLMDNLQRFVGETKPHPSRFDGLETEIKSLFKNAITQTD